MTVNKAFKILKREGITFKDYFDLVGLEIRKIDVKLAVDRIKTYITTGI